MITGAHVIIYSRKPDADRAFLRDVLHFSHVDAGGGWLIFALPPAEVALHPTEKPEAHELYLMCDDITEFRTEMGKAGVPTEAITDLRWGSVTHIELPSGIRLGVYEPKHASPSWKQRRRPSTRQAKPRPPN